MKKIGIITCGKEPNYGACLQALATQYKVAEFGYEAVLMNYSFMDEKLYSPFHQKSFRSFVSCTLFYPLRKSLHTAFQSFREKHMKYSSVPLVTPEDFQHVCDDYDAFLVGSDQVWNPELGIDTDITLLRFYENGPERLSYASSFGVSSLPKELHGVYRDALSRFSYISTREVTGKKLVYDLTGREAVVSLDPTMLLRDTEWSQFEENSGIQEPYVLIYDMRHSPMVMDTAKKLAEEKNCRVLALSRIVIHDSSIRTLYGINPGQFLSLIKNAAAIVTDSFHGTIFSITYKKEFYSYCSPQGMKIGSRITNILDSLDLGERLIHDGKDVVFSGIDYENVTPRLDQMREVSLQYLKSILAGEEETSEHCVTRLYCKKEKKQIEHVGLKEKDACCGCGACASVCPADAIVMKANEEGFLYPIVDEDKCIHCRRCIKTCAFESEYCDEHCNQPIQAYIARSTDEETLNHSASGGLFTVISDVILDRGGRVYGAAYDDEGSIHHICGQTSMQRDRMRGSKYVQSDTMQIFEAVRQDLQNGCEVLFTGTPCQTVALHSYLAKKGADRTKLFLCDIICHGVNSPEVWKQYLSFVSQKTGRITSINTRDKRYGSGYNMTISGEKGTYCKKGSDDPFIRLFQLNASLRSSCFACPMKRIERISDITIGDFQKAEKYFPEYADKKGVSVALINTQKGAALFDGIKDDLDFKESTMEAAMQVNLYTQIEDRSIRERFFKKYKTEDFISLMKEYTTLGAKNKMLYLAKEIIKKLIGR